MFKRSLLSEIQKLAKKYPVVTLLGPRQSGKTTLVKAAFSHMPYVTMEDAENRALAMRDPKSFLAEYPHGAIFDEVQKAPHLLSYIQVLVDKANQKGMFILAGSHKADASQSLAGRTSLLHLLPLSMEEIRSGSKHDSLDDIILKGGYPRIYVEDLPLGNAYSSYVQTYVEKDVRQLLQVKDIIQFERCIKLLAGRVGQLINYTSIAADVGVSAVTIKEWIAVLEATYILVRLEPYFENFGKRRIKSPKIYFTDTGLLCHLLGIDSTPQLRKDALYGNIFENWVVIELMKARYNRALDPNLFFYRDVAGKEIDIVFQRGSSLTPVEIKSGKTFTPSSTDGLDYFHKQASKRAEGGGVIYGGGRSQKIGPYRLLPAEECAKIFALENEMS